MEDPLFTTDPPAVPPNGSTPPAEPVAAPDSAAQIATMAETVTAQAGQITELTQAVTNLARGMQSSQTPTPVEPDIPEGDFNSRLIENAEGTIRDLVTEQMKGITPVLSSMLNSGSQAILAQRSLAVDQEFGSGAWKEFFAGPIAQIQEDRGRTNPGMLMDPGLMEGDINGLKGINMTKLFEFQTASRKTATDETTKSNDDLLQEVLSKLPRTNLTRGITSLKDGELVVDDDVKQFVAERAAASGTTINPEEWVKQHDYGNTIDDFEAHQKKLEAEEKS